MLKISHLCAGYTGREVLHNVTAAVNPGEITAVIGPNGCGKSTLLKTLCGLIPAASGTVELEGEDLLQHPQNERAKYVSYLAQNRSVPDITVGRLVLHGRFPYLNYPRRYSGQDYEIAENAMRQMGITELQHTPMNQLSGGQQQKAYIAMALAQDTRVLLLDEPTTYLDAAHQLQLLQYAKYLAKSGKYVLMVIHDISQALEYADRLLLMKGGTVVAEGSAESVYDSGKIEDVFSLKLNRLQAAGKLHYFWE